MAAKVEDLLLPEIWSNILTRVPVKSVLRCRSVCKSWYSLISCPNFISSYSPRNVNNRVLLQEPGSKGHVFEFSSHDKSFMESSEHDEVPEPFLDEHLIIVGSCNGLICLCKFDPRWFCGKDEIVLPIIFLVWNPAIRKIVVLPSRSYCSPNQYPALLGFGFDSNTSDYKVMCAVGKSTCGDFSDMLANGCEIFDSRKGAWRVISPQVDSSWDAVLSLQPECYLNGALHWTGGYKHKHPKGFVGRIILSFDMNDELYREIRMPDCADFALYGDFNDDRVHVRSLTFDGLISVIACQLDSNSYVDVSQSCSLWVMKEYGVTESWTKVLNIALSAIVLPTSGLWPSFFRLWGNGEVLMMHDLLVDEDVEGKEELITYNTESRKSKHLFRITKYIHDLCLYEESLVLM